MEKEHSLKAKTICEMYHNGVCLSDIARCFNNTTSNITQCLDIHYKDIYGTDYKTFTEKQKERLEELFHKFNDVYTPFTYTRVDICKMLNCTECELEQMFDRYNISHKRLQTFGTQRTLCNVPQSNYECYKEYAEKHEMSVRKLACRAINEYILLHSNDKELKGGK